MAAEALNDELKGPYIFHKDAWDQEKLKVLALYKIARYRFRLKTYFEKLDEATGRVTMPAECEAKAAKDERLRSLLFEEPYTLELDVAAKITSYYTIAAGRFHDSVCMRIESKFFHFLKHSLLDELTSGLETGGTDGKPELHYLLTWFLLLTHHQGHANCVRLLADNPARQARRTDLMRERAALVEGQHQLDELDKKYGDGFMDLPAEGTLGIGEGSLDEDNMDGISYGSHGLAPRF
jgi:hypothetical protein